MACQQCKILLLGIFISSAFAQDAQEYLQLAARAYKQLQSFQVEAEAERSSGGERPPIKAVVTLYSLPPHKARVEIKDSDRTLQSVLISNGKSVTEYRARKNEYTVLPVPTLSLSFTPERGAGWGEMLYDTIADGVSKASIRDRQVVEVREDRIPCVIVDADYGIRTSQYTFWIATDSGLVLRRVVREGSNGT